MPSKIKKSKIKKMKMKKETKESSTKEEYEGNLVYVVIKFVVDAINFIFFFGNENSFFYKDFLEFQRIHNSTTEFNITTLKISIFFIVYFVILSTILELNKSMMMVINSCEKTNYFSNIGNLITMSSLKYVFFYIFFPPSIFMGNFLDEKKKQNPSTIFSFSKNPTTIFFLQFFMTLKDKDKFIPCDNKSDENNSDVNNSDTNPCDDITKKPANCDYINILATFAFYVLFYILNRYLLQKILNFFPNYFYDFVNLFFSDETATQLSDMTRRGIISIIKVSDTIAFFYIVFANYINMMNILLSVTLDSFKNFWIFKFIFGKFKNSMIDGLFIIMNVIFVIFFFGMYFFFNFIKNEIRQIFFDVYGETKRKLIQMEEKSKKNTKQIMKKMLDIMQERNENQIKFLEMKNKTKEKEP